MEEQERDRAADGDVANDPIDVGPAQDDGPAEQERRIVDVLEERLEPDGHAGPAEVESREQPQ